MAKKNKYWQGRMDEIFRYLDETDLDIFKELSDIYSKYSKELQKEIFEFYGHYATDEKISLKEAKKQLRGEDLSDYQANAKKYFEQVEKDEELLKRLNQQYRSSKATRLEALELELQYNLGIMNGTLQRTFEAYLMSTASHAYRKIMGGQSSSTLNESALKEIIERPWEGHNYSQNLWGNTDNLARDLKKVFTKGFVRGLGPREMANEIRQKYKVGQSRAETLVRTDGSNVVNNAALKRYEDAGLKYVRINVKLDDRTTRICRTYHEENKRYLINDPDKPILPAHYNCRSGWLPDLEELEELE